MKKNITNPFFSVVIPVFNREKTISKTIQTCLDQTFIDFEIIVVDDCSTDQSITRIQDFKDPRIKLITQEINSERCISRNKGIELSTGQYICFLDSDDLFLPNHLDNFYSYLKSLSFPVAMIFSNSFLGYSDGSCIKKNVPLFNSENKFSYLLKYTPNPARVCTSRIILEKFQFDPKIPGIEDFDLWLRIATKFPVFHSEEFTSIYSIHEDMYSINSSKRFESELRMFKYVFNKGILKNILPKKSTRRLLSMCHFHLAKNTFDNESRSSLYYHSFKSFTLYPKGYNGKTNKILFVNALYTLPLFGMLFKKSISFIKK